jgi:site-specific recombinase XerD
MTTAALIEEYVTVRRASGLRFRSAATVLRTFARVAGVSEIHDVTQETVRAFLKGSGPITSGWYQKHYALAGLFRFAMQRGLVSTSPVAYRLPKRPAYATPYIYAEDELQRLLDATSALDLPHAKNGQPATIPALTFRTLIVLLYGAGLRLGEALALTLEDVDLHTHVLLVRNTKFFKTRLVPIGPRLASALERYADQRLAVIRRPPTRNAFLLRRDGRPISLHTAERYFRMLRSRVGLRRSDGAYFQPRLHDLRHSFAVHRLVAWYRQGADVQLLLPKLSTYLGHVSLAETQHYLTMTPDVLREAGRRFETYVGAGGQP